MRKIAFLSGGFGPLSPVLEKRHQFLIAAATEGTVIDMYGGLGSMESREGEYSPPKDEKRHTIESIYDEYMSVPETLRILIEAEQEGYDSVITSCGNDPGYDALLEAVKIPVIGPGSASMHICSFIGHRFTRLVTHRPGRQKLVRFAHENPNGLMKWVSSRSIRMTVGEARDYPEKAFESCLAQGRLAIEDDVADALTWSCSSLSFIEGLDTRLMEELGIPVVNPIKAAVRFAEYCVDFGIAQSKITYPLPKHMR
jgi:allantoin racemase